MNILSFIIYHLCTLSAHICIFLSLKSLLYYHNPFIPKYCVVRIQYFIRLKPLGGDKDRKGKHEVELGLHDSTTAGRLLPTFLLDRGQERERDAKRGE